MCDSLHALTPAQSRARYEPAEIAPCAVGDNPGNLDEAPGCHAVALPSPPRFGRDAARCRGLLDVSPGHMLTDQREPGSER